ncbi:hypothetical protein GCM10010269_73560 [Streptomyces humidus]|uniref:Uncharacterized protein n=1 Tax=Streptomyces humidus TaxID=52259 RepID=A0A918G935_9ACTN|nr:hypothetical protein GCM10010269_73560 [Streptomyces humidus]
MRAGDDDVDGHGQRKAVAIRWIQVAILGVVVLSAGFRVWEREPAEPFYLGLMAASVVAIGTLERYRANAARRSR